MNIRYPIVVLLAFALLLLPPARLPARDHAIVCHGSMGTFADLYPNAEVVFTGVISADGGESIFVRIAVVLMGDLKSETVVEIDQRNQRGWPMYKVGAKVMIFGKPTDHGVVPSIGDQGVIVEPSAALIDYYKGLLAIKNDADRPAALRAYWLAGMDSADDRVMVECSWDLWRDLASSSIKGQPLGLSAEQKKLLVELVAKRVRAAKELSSARLDQMLYLIHAAELACGDDPALRVALWELAQHTEPNLIGRAGDAMAVLRNAPQPEETNRFIELTNSPSEIVAVYAAQALFHLNNEAALKCLRELRQNSKRKTLQRTAAALLENN